MHRPPIRVLIESSRASSKATLVSYLAAGIGCTLRICCSKLELRVNYPHSHSDLPHGILPRRSRDRSAPGLTLGLRQHLPVWPLEPMPSFSSPVYL